MLMYYVCVLSGSVMSSSLWLYELKPSRFLCPWNFPDKNTGAGCHFLLQGIFPTLGSNPLPASPALAGEFFTTEPPRSCKGKKKNYIDILWKLFQEFLRREKIEKDYVNLCVVSENCSVPFLLSTKYSIGPITENSLKKKRWIMFMASCSKYIVICHNIQKVK